MGCNIHAYIEIKKEDNWDSLSEPIFKLDHYDKKAPGETHTVTPFKYRNYGLFGFLADVRNYSCIPPIVTRRGVPESPSMEFAREYERGRHSFSWIAASELLSFNYDASFEDRRDMNGNSDTLAEGEGVIVTYREFLGARYFDDLEAIRRLGDPTNVRLVFCFDS